jgi:hypothetical protein
VPLFESLILDTLRYCIPVDLPLYNLGYDDINGDSTLGTLGEEVSLGRGTWTTEDRFPDLKEA